MGTCKDFQWIQIAGCEFVKTRVRLVTVHLYFFIELTPALSLRLDPTYAQFYADGKKNQIARLQDKLSPRDVMLTREGKSRFLLFNWVVRHFP